MKLKSLIVLVALFPNLVFGQVVLNSGTSVVKPAGVLPTPTPQTTSSATKQTATVSSAIPIQDTSGIGKESKSTSLNPCTDYGSVQDCNRASKTKSE